MKYEYEQYWESIKTYFDSSLQQSNSKILFTSGGSNDQPFYFWEMIKIVELAIYEFKKWTKEHGG